MTLEYVATPQATRADPTSRARGVELMSIWLTVLAIVNLAAAMTVMLVDCSVWVLFGIFLVDAVTICANHRYERTRS